MRRRLTSSLLLAGLLLGGCTRQRPTPHPVAMVPLPPPEAAPHAQATVAVGGGVIFEADDAVSVEAEPPGLVRAYATKTRLALIGEAQGRTTVKLRLRAGDVFYLDVDITGDAPAERALAVGEPYVITYDGVTDFTVTADRVEARKSVDGTQLILTPTEAGGAVVTLTMKDGSVHRVQIIVIGGERLL